LCFLSLLQTDAGLVPQIRSQPLLFQFVLHQMCTNIPKSRCYVEILGAGKVDMKQVASEDSQNTRSHTTQYHHPAFVHACPSLITSSYHLALYSLNY